MSDGRPSITTESIVGAAVSDATVVNVYDVLENALPQRSITLDVTFVVYVVPAASSVSGTIVSVCASVPSDIVAPMIVEPCLNVMFVKLSDAGSIGSLKTSFTVVMVSIDDEPLAGVML